LPIECDRSQQDEQAAGADAAIRKDVVGGDDADPPSVELIIPKKDYYDDDDDLPENIFCMDRCLEEIPLVRDGSAFFDTMNSESSKGEK